MTGGSETRLLERCLEDRSAEAFERLMRHYLPFVRKLMYKLSMDDDAADDLTQEVFIKVHRNLSTFRREAKFTTWLYRIAVNTVSSHRRHRARRADLAQGLSRPAGVEAARCPQAASGAEGHLAISDALASLPLKLRSAIVLTVIEGLSYEEVARIEGCTRSTIYWRVHKARLLLKKHLGEYL